MIIPTLERLSPLTLTSTFLLLFSSNQQQESSTDFSTRPIHHLARSTIGHRISSILSDIPLPPLSLRDMASILQQVATPADTQEGTPAVSSPTPTPTPPPANTENAQPPTSAAPEKTKETATKEKEQKKGKEEPQTTQEVAEVQTTTTTQVQETLSPSPSPPITTVDSIPSSDSTSTTSGTDSSTDTSLSSNSPTDSLFSTLSVVSVASGSILLPSTILVLDNSPLTMSRGTPTRTSGMKLPGIVTGNGSPLETAGTSSQQLGGMDASSSSSSSTQPRGPGAGAVFGFVALACVLVMAVLSAMKKISAYRESSRMPLYPDSERGGQASGVGGGSRGIRSSRGWTALGSPMSRASSWFGVEGDGGGSGGGSGSQSEKMVYGKSRDSSLYLAAGTNRAGLGTSSVGLPSPNHHYTPSHHGRQPSLPAMPSRAALASSASAKSSPPSPLTAYVVTYDETSNDQQHLPAPTRPTLSPLSTSLSSSHNKYSMAPPPTPTAGSDYEELAETEAPLNTSAYPSTEDVSHFPLLSATKASLTRRFFPSPSL